MDPRTVLLLALVASTGAVPIGLSRPTEDMACAKTCSGSGKFSYEPGKTYEFVYETGTHTGIEGAAEDKSSLLMMVNVHVEVMSPCEFVLKMNDVQLKEIDPEHPSRTKYSPKSEEFRRSLEEHPLRFGFQDGRIESVCPSERDAVWIVNIKRGVLSTFQNVMDSLDRDQRVTETDIAGECDAEYKVTKPSTPWSRTMTVKKTKNLMGCRSRNGYNSAIQAIPYNVQSDVQSLPLLKSRHDCEQEIEGGKLIRASCKERHVFRPFSKGSNGAVTETTQKLTFNKEKSSIKSKPEFIDRRSDLHFEHTPKEGAGGSSVKASAEDKLESLCRLTREDIRPETPQLFADLVHLLRELDSNSLRELYRKVKDSSFCRQNEERTRKFFMDAIPMVGTKASVGMIENLISKGIVDGVESYVWVTSLAFIANPSREMLTEIKPLLRNKPTGHVMLSVSALVNNYCRVTSCENDIEVDEIVSILEENLGHQCDIRGNDAEKILFSLRAIGNTGHAEKAVPTLNRCLAKADLPMEIRLSAVNAFRHMSCKADLNNIMSLFRNKDEDSELRIAAYLSVIECPTQWVLDQVKETLESEEVNQVGSFVWSHLTNLMETSDPHKQAIRAILEDETLAKEFDMDKRKFSRNYEGSLFIEKFNTGAKAESNVIWSSKSFLPRSAMLNLTVDLFGHAINLVEIGGRVEGLEYYLESLFGPEGALQEPSKDTWKRSKRQVVRRDKLDSIKQRYGITSDEVAGSVYFRMFGNELSYLSMGGPGKSKKSSRNVMDMLLKLAKENSYQITQNVMFMDSTIVVPTSVGIPLRLTVNGTASVDLKVSGKMDVRKATSRPSNMHIEGVIQPSGAVEVASTMVVDAYLVRSGLKMVTTLHSSTAANGKLEVKNGQVLNVELDSPRDKMEIINLNTKFFVLHREAEREQKMIDVDRKVKRVCSGDYLAKLTGMEICGSVGFSNASSKDEAPYFPLTGPLNLDINLRKTDSHSGYIFSAKYSSDPSRRSARVSFDTPGSRENRQLVTDIELDLKDKKLDMNLVTPWRKASAKGSIVNDDDLKRASLRVVVGGQKEYNVNGEVKIEDRGKRVKYIPLLEISAPSMKTVTVGGSIEKVEYEALELDLSMQNILRNPVNLRSTIVNNDKQKSVTGSFSNGKDIYTATSKVLIKSEKKAYGYNATLNMRCPKGELILAEAYFDNNPKKSEVRLLLDKVVANPIKLAGSIGTSQTKRSNKHTLEMDIDTPLVGLDVNGFVDKKNGKKEIFTSKATVNYQLPNKIRDRVTVSSKIRNLSTQSLSKVDIVLNTNFKKNRDYNFQSSANFELSSTNLDSSLELQYGDNPKDEDKKITFSQSGSNRLKGGKRNSNLNVNLKYPAKNVDIQLKGTHLHTNSDLDSNIVIRLGSDRDIDANLKLSDDMRRKNTLSGEIGLTYPGRRLRATTEFRKINDKQYNNTIDLVWGKGGKAKIETTYGRPSKISHEAVATIHVARKPQVVLSGLINLDRQDFKISTGAVVGKDKYKAAVTQNRVPHSFDADVDLLYPDRHVIAEVGLDWRDKYTGKVDLKLDADNDKSNRLKADGDLELNGISNIRGSINAQSKYRKVTANIRHQSNDKHVSHVDLTYAPGKVIELDTSFSDAKGWSNRKIGGSLRLTSPFKGARFIEVNTEHSIDSLQFDTVADIAWSRADKVTSALTIKRPISLRKLENTLTITTPFSEYRKISAEINHRADDDLATSVKAEAGIHNIDISLTASNKGSDTRRDASGELIVKSSIPDLERIIISASHNDDGRKFDSALTADIGQHGTYSVDLDMTHDGSSYYIDNRGKVIISTPIRSYKKIVTSWSHRGKENSLKSSLSCAWNNNKLSLKVDGTHRSSQDQRLIAGTVNVETPLHSLRELVLTLNHDHKKEELQSSASMVRNRYKRTEYNIAYTVDDDYNIESTAMFTCPGLNTLNAKLATKLSDTPQSAEAEFEWSPSEKIALSGELTQNGLRYIDTSVRFTSPFRGVERVVVSGRHAKNDGIWVSTAALEYAPRQEINIRSRFALESTKLAELTVTAPFYHFQKLKLSAEHSGDVKRQINSKALIELQPQLGVLEATANLENGRQLAGSARINTPFRAVPYSEARFTYEPGKANVEVEYLPNQVVTIDTEYRLDNVRDLAAELTLKTPITSFDFIKTTFLHRGSLRRSRSVVSVEYPKENVFSATANYENDDKFEASLDLRAPEYDDVRLSVTHSGTARNFNTHGEITYQRYKKFEGDVVFSLKRGLKGPVVSLVTVAKCPYSENFDLKLSHEGNIVDFKTNLIGSYGRENRLTYNLGYSTSPSSLRADTDFDLQSKYTQPHSASAAFNLEGEARDFKSRFDGNYQGEAINSALSVKLIDGIDSTFTLNTPFDAVRNIDASLKHTAEPRTEQKIRTNGKLLFNRKEFVGDVSFSRGREHVDATVNVKTPFSGYRDLTSSLRFDGNLKRLRTSSNIEIEDGRSIQMTGNLDLESRNRKFDVTVHTPFQDYETVSASGNLTGTPTDFDLNAHVQYATRNRIELNGKFDIESPRKVLEATILTPIEGYDRLSVSGDVKGELKRFTSNANVEYGSDRRIEASLESNIEGKVKDVSVSVKTPFENFRDTSASGKFEGDLLREFSSSATFLYLDGQRISFSSSGDLKRNPKSISADLRTPFEKLREVGVVGNFNGYLKHFKADGQINIGRTRLDAIADVDLEGNQKKVSGIIKTPFEGYERLSAEGNYDTRQSRHEVDLSVEYAPNKKIEAEAGLTLRERKSIRVSIKTPFVGYEKLSAKGNFDENFNSDAELEYAPNKKIQISSNIDLKSSPKSVSVSVKTPFRGWEAQSFSGSVSGEIRRCEVDARVSYGDRKTLTLNGAVDIVNSPITINCRVTTPYPGYETQAFAITFQGQPLNFQSSATVESSQLRKPILARASVAYNKPTDMDAVITFTSAIRNAEILKLVVKNKDDEKYTSHIEGMWAPRKSIELDGSLEQKKRWRNTNTAGEISISTPFEQIRKAGVRFEDTISRKKRSAEANIEYEGKNILTVKSGVADGEVNVGLDLRHPRPMKFKASGNVNSDSKQGTVFLDWNSRNPTSNVELTVKLDDGTTAYTYKKDVNVKVIHPEHSVDVTGKLERSPYRFLSSGAVTVNDRKVSTEVELNDRSQGYTKVYQGKVKLSTPYRSLKLEGSHSDDVSKMNDEIVASWDAERDESKKAVFSSEVQKLSGKNLKTDIKLELPSVGREIRLVTESETNRGRTLFDGKTELFYSSDSRKKLTITSKIEDSSSGYGDSSNYTMTLSLLHPSTNTDIQVISHAGKTNERVSAAAEVNYLSSRRQRENMQLRGEIDRLRKQVNLEVVSPIKSIEITGKLRTEDGYHLSLHNVYDKSKSIDTTISVDLEKGNILLTMGSDLHDPRNTVNLRAGYLDDRQFSVEAYHVSREGRETDGLLALTLNSSRILHTRIHWRPSVIREIKEELDRRSEVYQGKLASSIRDAIRDVAEEWDNRQRLISREIQQDLRPVKELINREWNAVDIELARILEELNNLGLKEALAAVQDAMDATMKFADETLSEMSESYNRAVAKIEEIWEDAYINSVRYEEIVGTSVELVKEYYVEVEQFIEKVVRASVDEIEAIAQKVVYHYSKAEAAYRGKIRDARVRVSELTDRVLNHPKIQELKRQYSDLIDRIPDLPSTSNIKAASRRVQDTLKAAVEKYPAIVESTRQKVAQTIKDILNRDELRRLHSVANEVYQQGKWAYDYWEVEKNVEELARSVVDNVRELVSEEIKDIRDSILNLDKFRVIVYSPQDGEIQFETFLPVALKSLRALPDASVQKYARTYKKFANSYIPSRNFSVYDTYYSMKPSKDVGNWIPPFKAHASISGKQHFTTFDGRHFDFAGLCSYVLAHDFMDGNFSVILNYDGDWVNFRKKSLSITTRTKNIDIFPDYKVHVGGRPQELPYEDESTIVKRDGSIIRVESRNGVEVECDLAHDIYTVTISGWYYGKTAGLFGTYDNEPSNDLVTSSHETTDDIQAFADSWEVAGSCRSSRNFAKPAIITPEQPGFDKCRSLFQDYSSPYRHCFKQVEPLSAMAKCMEDHLLEMTEYSACNATAQYIRECKLEGVIFEMPLECVRCEAPKGGVYKSGEPLILSEEGIRPPRSADVVFVIEEKVCNKDAATELQTLAQSIESAFRNNRLVGNRFGIVGYGGPKSCDEFHTHTIDGQIMNDARRFGVGVDSLRFDKNGKNSDVLGAIKFAANYPFRAGVSKSIVLMPCSTCAEKETTYAEIKEFLLERGINLHLLMEHDFEFRSNKSPKSTNVFGIDKDGAYAFKRRGGNQGDSKLLGELRVPTDNCVSLSQNTKGTMFNLARLTEGRQRMQKSFRDVWSRKIAQSADPMSCQECKCEADENGVGVSVCTRCDKSTSYTAAIQSLMPNSRKETRPVYDVPGARDDFDGQLKEYMNVYSE